MRRFSVRHSTYQNLPAGSDNSMMVFWFRCNTKVSMDISFLDRTKHAFRIRLFVANKGYNNLASQAPPIAHTGAYGL